MLGQRDPIFPLRQCPEPRRKSMNARCCASQAEHQTGSRRIAKRRLAVCVEKQRPLGRKAVDMRRLRHRVTAKCADPIILVVDRDEDDIRTGRVVGSTSSWSNGREQQSDGN